MQACNFPHSLDYILKNRFTRSKKVHICYGFWWILINWFLKILCWFWELVAVIGIYYTFAIIHIIFFIYYFLFYYLTSQYYIGFAIHQHESATGIHVFPILNPPPSLYYPSGSSQCTSPKHPVLCIEPGLVTHFIYDIIHVSMPFSQIIPPSPSPRVQKTVLYISVSFAVSYTGLLLPSL